MTQRISIANAKAQFSAVVDAVLHDDEHYIIERHGRPVAALVRIEDLERLEASRLTAETPGGLLAFVGGWGLEDAEIDAFLRQLQDDRSSPPRPDVAFEG